MPLNIVIFQIVGIIAFILQSINFVQKSKIKLIYQDTFIKLFWIVHYFGMGKPVAGQIAIIGAIRNYLSTVTGKLKILSFSILSLIILSLLYYNRSILDSVLLVATVFNLYAVFFFDSKNLKLAFVLTELIWLIVNTSLFSIGGILTNLTTISVLSFNLWKNHYKIAKNR